MSASNDSDDRTVVIDRPASRGKPKRPDSAEAPTRSDARPEDDATIIVEQKASTEAAPFQKVGDYQIVKELGRGGWGVVYKALHQGLGRMVALKVLHSSTGVALKRFDREIHVQARLRHPNICPIFDAGVAPDGRPYLVMDYIDGQPLTKLILNKALTDRQIGVLLSKVARALHHAHERGILHRDIKPDNILVDKNRQPFVVDFGIARDQEEEGEALTRVGQVVGTPYYIAPEQIRSLGLGPHTDVWALGVVLYVTLSGKPPFRGKSELETLEKVLRVEPERPVREGKPVPNDLWAICSRCLQKDPAKRYRDAQQLALDLERYVRDEPTSVAPPGLGAQVQRWIRHRAWPVHAAAFGVASAAVFVTLFALFAQGLAAFVPASQVGEVRAWMGRSLGVGWLVMALAGTGIAKVLSKKPSAQPDGDGDCL